MAAVGVEEIGRLLSEHVRTASPLQLVVRFVGREPHLAQLKTKTFFGEEREIQLVALATCQPHYDLPVAQSANPMSVTFSALMLAMASRSAMSAPRFMRAGLPAS